MSPAQKKLAEHIAAMMQIAFEEDRKDDNSTGDRAHIIAIDTFWSLFHDFWGPMRDIKRYARLDGVSMEEMRDRFLKEVQNPEVWDRYEARYRERLRRV